jgi:hypothetical protein
LPPPGAARRAQGDIGASAADGSQDQLRGDRMSTFMRILPPLVIAAIFIGLVLWLS